MLDQIRDYFSRNRLAKYVLAGALTLGAIGATPSVVNAVKKTIAKNLVEEAGTSISRLEDRIALSETTLENNSYLMKGDEEITPLVREIQDSKSKIDGLNLALERAKANFAGENYKAVRDSLGKKSKIVNYVSPIIIAQTETGELEQRVIEYCREKKSTRDAIIDNELKIKATLMKAQGLEANEDLAMLPEKYKSIVPVLTPELEDGLGKLPAALNNSMGKKYLANEEKYSHIMERAITQSARRKAEGFYAAALNFFQRVKPQNDSTLWYRAEKDDGHLTLEEQRKLLAQQEGVIGLIHSGDNSLTDLSKLHETLHRPYVVYISENRTVGKSFKHFKTTKKKDGSSHTSTYKTQGYEYYYVLNRIDLDGETSSVIKAGEEDSHMSWPLGEFIKGWDFPQEQRKGFVREYRPLHSDTVSSGWMGNLNPKIESCNE
ncbi:hypothetical protein KA107_03295 [Candidatus Pacearchaeota archaeon]|nr:hypothetical protein [Candidatus Pacearchaeota archaeon]